MSLCQLPIGTGTSCKGQLTNYFFNTGFVVAEGEFPSYCNHQLIKFKENKRFGLYCNYVKRER